MLRIKKISSNTSKSTKLRIKKKAQLEASVLLEEAFSKQKSNNNNNSQQNNLLSIFETQNKSFNNIPAVVYENDNIVEKNSEQEILSKNNLSDDDDLYDMIDLNVKVTFQDLIAGWALKNCVPHLILNELLKILKSNGHPDM